VLFLADESCDFAVVLALRPAGHDVAVVAQDAPGLTDRDVMTRAQAEHRVVITEDKDFGQLVFSGGRASAGCLFLRYPAPARRSLFARVWQTAFLRPLDIRPCGRQVSQTIDG
jgi:hypothetical protein